MSGSDLIQHVSDTALWIAAYRAQETARPDAVFKDPFAARLAGTRGVQMVAATPHTETMAFCMVARTTAIDRLILSTLDRGIDTVINLGAGLDARPYRMSLPANLKWIEVDFAHMIDYKNEMLKNEQPVCSLQRIACDLSLQTERLKLFSSLDANTKKALIITEGVVTYLTNDQAAELSKDIYAMPHFNYWIQDYRLQRMNQKQMQQLQKIVKNTPFRFDAPDPIAFFSNHGWRVVENIFLMDESDRIGRKIPLEFPWSLMANYIRKKYRDTMNKIYAFVLFAKE